MYRPSCSSDTSESCDMKFDCGKEMNEVEVDKGRMIDD